MVNIEYANAVFKDAALLQGKLNDSNVSNEGLRKDLFQKQLENEDLRQRLQILEAITGRDTSFMSILDDPKGAT